MKNSVIQEVKRKEYPKRKAELLDSVKKAAQRHPNIAVADLHKVRATQLMTLRKSFRDKLEIIVCKNRIASMGIRAAGLVDADKFSMQLQGQRALIFTDMSPFKLNMLLAKSSVLLPAKAGDIATDDIIVPAGNTGLPPGPVLSEFKEAGVSTKIDTGSIWVTKDSLVAPKGAAITSKLAGLLSRLGIKPIKAGISLSAAYLEGLILKEDDLKLDLDELLLKLQAACRSAFNLAVNSGYPTPESLPRMLGKASAEAMALVVSTGYVSKDSVGMVLGAAHVKATTLHALVQNRGYGQADSK